MAPPVKSRRMSVPPPPASPSAPGRTSSAAIFHDSQFCVQPFAACSAVGGWPPLASSLSCGSQYSGQFCVQPSAFCSAVGGMKWPCSAAGSSDAMAEERASSGAGARRRQPGLVMVASRQPRKARPQSSGALAPRAFKQHARPYLGRVWHVGRPCADAAARPGARARRPPGKHQLLLLPKLPSSHACSAGGADSRRLFLREGGSQRQHPRARHRLGRGLRRRVGGPRGAVAQASDARARLAGPPEGALRGAAQQQRVRCSQKSLTQREAPCAPVLRGAEGDRDRGPQPGHCGEAHRGASAPQQPATRCTHTAAGDQARALRHGGAAALDPAL